MLVLILIPAVVLCLVLLSVLYWNFRKGRKFWREKNVPHKEPRFLSGNFAQAGVKNLGVIFRELYEEGKNEKFFGVWQFNVPVLLLIDLELVKAVFVADFSSFDDHGVYYDERTDPLAVNLLTMGGASWRNIRTKLNPAFTAGKLRMMFPIIQECGEELARVLRPAAERQEVVEFKDLAARYTTDVISSCAFGIEANSLKNKDAIFRKMGKEVFQSSWEVLWRNFAGFLFPGFARFFKIRIYPKKVTDFFLRVMRETMTFRETNNVKRNDILQMLIQLKNDGYIRDVDVEDNQEKQTLLSTSFRDEIEVNEDTGQFVFTSMTALQELLLLPNDAPAENKTDKFGYEQAAAQAFIFFTAGFDTSSTALQYTLYELAMNPEIQRRVREEMQDVIAKNGGTLTYDTVLKMTYLGRVLDETLRKYPPATNISRICTKEYRIPGTDIVLEKGTQLSVSVLGLHWDDRYYPEPEKFDPDRFTEEQKSSRPPYTYLPFGEGPRTCIGQRFGLTQIKVGLISILTNYEVSIAKETCIPPVLDPKSFFSAPKGGMHLRISLLDKKMASPDENGPKCTNESK